MTLDETILAEAKQTRDRLLELQHEVERARTDYHHSIRRLHAAGGSLREIADSLGLSHQRVHQVVEVAAGEPGDPPATQRVRDRTRRWIERRFERFTARAREVVVLAEEEARALRHNYLGTEHILLGLLRVEDGVAARALGSLGVTLEETQAEIRRLVGAGDREPPARLPFTPRAKKALDLSLREARALKHNYIGPEHVLLGLVREREGVAARILCDLGADEPTVRAALAPLLDRSA